MELNRNKIPPFNKLIYWESLGGNGRLSIVLNRTNLAWLGKNYPIKYWQIYQGYRHERYIFGYGWKIYKQQTKIEI
jgi:hypothetical protein